MLGNDREKAVEGIANAGRFDLFRHAAEIL